MITNLIAACCLSLNISNSAPSICDAIYRIEGGIKTAYPYGIRSIKTKNPRKVCLNTVLNQYSRWDKKGCYFDSLADRYCPPSADKQGNINWKKNIKKVLNHHD